MFTTPEELSECIAGYFNGGAHTRQIVVGREGQKKVITIPILTITGLALFLGFESRQSFYDYEKKLDFSYTIKKARTFIENDYEELLKTQANPTGIIFALKNFGWKDKSELEMSGYLADTRAKLKEFLDESNDGDPTPDDNIQDDAETNQPDDSEEV